MVKLSPCSRKQNLKDKGSVRIQGERHDGCADLPQDMTLDFIYASHYWRTHPTHFASMATFTEPGRVTVIPPLPRPSLLWHLSHYLLDHSKRT